MSIVNERIPYGNETWVVISGAPLRFFSSCTRLPLELPYDK